MYGTVARLRVKSGMESKLIELQAAWERVRVPGSVVGYLYRMDDNPNEYYLTVVFKDRDAYVANANSAEQDARYREMRALLSEDPEWHDGEVVSGGK